MREFNQILQEMVTEFKRQNLNKNRAAIHKASPYSDQITTYISSLDELNAYLSFGLKETILTRPALITIIDPFYIDEDDEKNNIEKMLLGKPPIDAATGSIIHLHHLGQQYEAPFAELPQEVHESNGFILHKMNAEESWRQDKSKLNDFAAEKRRYWILRARRLIENEKAFLSDGSSQNH